MQDVWQMGNKQLKRYILVHGAWHGSWCWNKVAPQIRSRGHEVITPDLPGHYRHKRNFQDVRLTDYVRHIETFLLASPKPAVLVGHSMAGIIISQAAENMPDTIDHLIYVSAFIPENGGSLMEEEKQGSIPTVASAVIVNPENYSISLKLDPVPDLFYGNCNNEDTQYALSLLQPQPLQPFMDTIALSDARFGRTPKLYIECLKDKAIKIEDQRRMHSKIKCPVATINTDHSPFFSADHTLAALICGDLEPARKYL